MIKEEIIRFNDNLYIPRYKFLDSPKIKTEELRNYLGMDIVLRKENFLFFCEQIPEAEVISYQYTLQLPFH